VHGPFPARMRFFGFALAFVFVGALLTWLALRTERLACPATGTCTIDGRAAFDRDSLREVRIEHRTGSKGSKYDVVVFDMGNGRKWDSMQVEPGDADLAVSHIREARASGQGWDETLHGPQFLAPFVEPPGPFPPLPPEGAQLAAETSNAFVGLGWAYPADSYRWTDGTHASLRFAAPAAQPGVLEIQMRPYLEGPLREQTVTVSLNGRSLQTFVLRAPEMATFEVPVPSGLIAAENTLRLDLPQATRPSSLGRSRDRRVLGVAVHSVRWSVGATALAR